MVDEHDPLPFPDKQISEQGRLSDQGFAEQVAVEEPAEIASHDRLRAAEVKLLGEDVSRHEGKPERGIGSKYHALHPAHKAHLAAIEHLIEVEKEHAVAEAHLNSVHAKVEQAMERVDATEQASDDVTATAVETEGVK